MDPGGRGIAPRFAILPRQRPECPLLSRSCLLYTHQQTFGGKPTRYGVEVFEGTRTERLGSFLAWLTAQLGMETYRDLDVVVYERPFARGAAATRSLWGMAGVVEAACQEHGVAVVDAEVQTVKKFVAKGHAAKHAVINRATTAL